MFTIDSIAKLFRSPDALTQVNKALDSLASNLARIVLGPGSNPSKEAPPTPPDPRKAERGSKIDMLV